jgi:flavin reductase
VRDLGQVDIGTFQAGMRRLAAGVCVVSAGSAKEPHGLLATSVTSLSGEPPSLLVCLNQGASGHDPLLRSRAFCVNVLAQRQKLLAASFTSSKRRRERFRESDWTVSKVGIPALNGALAVFECRLDRAIPYGSHTIVIGLIDAISTDGVDLNPLLYFDGAFRMLEDEP